MGRLKSFIVLFVVLAGVFLGCVLIFVSRTEKSHQNSGLPNPASAYCEDQGYELEIRESEEGQYGVCIFPDGSECEEWEYYRGECKIGDSLK